MVGSRSTVENGKTVVDVETHGVEKGSASTAELRYWYWYVGGVSSEEAAEGLGGEASEYTRDGRQWSPGS